VPDRHPGFLDRIDPEAAPILDLMPGNDLSTGIAEARARSIEALDALRPLMPEVPGVAMRDVMVPG